MSDDGPPAAAAPPRLLADAMLGGLARWLRIVGADTAYDPKLDDATIARRAVAEARMVLTRDRRLVERRALRDRHLLVRSERVGEQLRQVVDELALSVAEEGLLTRCLRCNAPLQEIPAQVAALAVPSFVARTQTRFRQCPACDRLYWRATHADRMRDQLAAWGVLSRTPPEPA